MSKASIVREWTRTDGSKCVLIERIILELQNNGARIMQIRFSLVEAKEVLVADALDYATNMTEFRRVQEVLHAARTESGAHVRRRFLPDLLRALFMKHAHVHGIRLADAVKRWLPKLRYNMDPKVEQIEHPDPLVELIESVGPWLKETFPYWDMPDFTPKVNGEAIANRPTCPLQLAEMAEVGDHIAVKAKSGYWHHGIFVGRVEKGPYMVIDVYGDDKALSTICNRTLTAFTNGGTDYAIIPYDETISKEHSALIALHLQQTAEKQRWHYNAISNNCEHFATLCRCGRKLSLQVMELYMSILNALDHLPKDSESIFILFCLLRDGIVCIASVTPTAPCMDWQAKNMRD
eukprot:gene29617-biopygen11531